MVGSAIWRNLEAKGYTHLIGRTSTELDLRNQQGVNQFYQTEKTPFYPRSPYAVAKMYAYWITVNYREAYKLYACNGILFNHESPIRGETFVTRKITRAVSKIALEMQDKFHLGNLDAKRDWGHAKDYIRMMWMILQADKAEDWVIATGKTTTVRDFVRMSFSEVGVELKFKGQGLNEVGVISAIDEEKYNNALLGNVILSASPTESFWRGVEGGVEVSKDKPKSAINLNMPDIGKEVLAVDSRYFRPTEVELLIGDATKAKEKLGWVPKIKLPELVRDMMQSDLKLMQKDQYLKDGNYTVKNYFE